ncbi:hypothetical protein [Gramella sp. AN32]|uniref:Uncharacterized protein n=1 Tax=Christiangramia antarctica TaxID=2058158 RepID=A0ABW5X6R9_9FLAO|nr:hypothetical protein [Gramella sp. AN32]MCM4158164.1 hypothetical protein [Gramella sp. AN32]
MPRIIINRNSEWANKWKNFDLFLNDEHLSVIEDKETLTFNLPKGSYILRAKMDWCSSQSYYFELQENQDRYFEVTGFIFSKYLLPLAFGCFVFFWVIYFLYDFHSISLAFILMAFMGYILYFMSIGRNQFLQIKEITGKF